MSSERGEVLGSFKSPVEPSMRQNVGRADVADLVRQPRSRGRRRSLSRRWRRSSAVKKLQRIIALTFVSIVVVAASVYFARSFSAYHPPGETDH